MKFIKKLANLTVLDCVIITAVTSFIVSMVVGGYVVLHFVMKFW